MNSAARGNKRISSMSSLPELFFGRWTGGTHFFQKASPPRGETASYVLSPPFPSRFQERDRGNPLFSKKRVPPKNHTPQGGAMNFLYILAALLLLGILVTIHESGHFFAARMTGIPVKEFAIGFGPKILSWKRKKHDTQFFLRLIPAGGYCMFYGEDDAQGKAKNDPRAIQNFAVWKRFITIFMGPMMNFILALVAATTLYMAVGESTDVTFTYSTVQAVSQGSPAEAAGLQAGDVILSINGQDAAGLAPEDAPGVTLQDGLPQKNGVLYTRFSYLLDACQPQDAPLTLEISRSGETLTAALTRVYDEKEARYLMGVTVMPQYTANYAPVSLFRAASLGADYCVRAAGSILTSLKDVITSGQGLADGAGPVGIVQMIAEETQASGWLTYAQLLVLISVNLGLFNLIPIPGLDGARLVFLIIEGIRRKPVPQKVEAYVHMSGYLILMCLMIVLTYKDILRIFK